MGTYATTTGGVGGDANQRGLGGATIEGTSEGAGEWGAPATGSAIGVGERERERERIGVEGTPGSVEPGDGEPGIVENGDGEPGIIANGDGEEGAAIEIGQPNG